MTPAEDFYLRAEVAPDGHGVQMHDALCVDRGHVQAIASKQQRVAGTRQISKPAGSGRCTCE